MASTAHPSSSSPLLSFLNTNFGMWICTALLVPIAGFVYSHVQQTVDAERIAGETRRLRAIESARLIHEWAPEITSTDVKKAKLAAIVLSHAAKNGSLEGSLSQSVSAIVSNAYQDGTKPGATVQEMAVANAIAKVDDPPSTSPVQLPFFGKLGSVPTSNRLPIALKPRVYVQIGNNGQRSKMEGISEMLRNQAFQVPSIELVRAVPRQTEVRYYFNEDAQAAGEIVSVLRRNGLPNAISLKLSDKYASKVRKGHFEVWVGYSSIDLRALNQNGPRL